MPQVSLRLGTLAFVFHCVLGVAAAAQPAAAISGSSQPVRSAQGESVEAKYAARLAELGDSDWRTAFALGQEIADLPPEQGWAVMQANWSKVQKPESRQQLLKAWFYGRELPLKPRSHPHVGDVLKLGKQDPSPQVQEWADNFLKKAAGGAPGKAGAVSEPEAGADVADIPLQDLHAGGDENKRFFLIGPRVGAKKPAAGYRLVLVLPGGDGSAEFRPFVQRMLKNSLSDDAVIAELVAPKWSESQGRVVWPTSGLKDERMKFTTEEFVASVIDEVNGKLGVDPARIDALGWSSGGPAVYAASLAAGSRVRGAFVAMSVFKPELLPPLAGAKGRRFYIFHSPQDGIPMKFPQDAEAKLREAGGTAMLATYEGGHGWHGDVFGNIRKGLDWLEKPAK